MSWFRSTGCLLVAVLLLGVAFVKAEVGADTCAAAENEKTIGYFQSNSESFFAIDPVSLANVPGECLPVPATSNMVGAWYALNVPGVPGLELESKVFTSTFSGTSPHTLAVMQGNCSDSSLTCLAQGQSQPDDRGRVEANVPFTLTTNTPYLIFAYLENVTGEELPGIGVAPDGGKAQCEFFRSEQMLFDSFSEDGIGSCQPCTNQTNATHIQWQTACEDGCEQCYDVESLTEEGPFCFEESRHWSATFALDGSSRLPTETYYCYSFSDGNYICDDGPKAGACPRLAVNGEQCISCVNAFDPTNFACDFPDENYGNFVADCTNVEGGALVDKCQNTGFESSVLSNYAIYTDIRLANIPAFAGECTYNMTAADLGFTAAPTPDPSPITTIPLSLDESTQPFDMSMGEERIFEILVTDVTGIFTCMLQSDNDNGDIDLYMGIDTLPTESFQCSSASFNSDEDCSVVVGGGSMSVFALVYALNATTGVVIECGDIVGEDDARDFDVGVNEMSSSFDLDAGEYRLYRLDAPSGSFSVNCNTEVDDGDLDLFMRNGQIPVPSQENGWDCISNSVSGEESCEVLTSGGDMYILLKGYGPVEAGRLTCNVVLDGAQPDEDDVTELDLGEPEEFDLLENQIRQFFVALPAGTSSLTCRITSDTGIAVLYARVGEPAVPSEGGECSSSDTGGTCATSFEFGLAEDTEFYVTAQGITAAEDVNVECRASVPLTEDDAIQRTMNVQTSGLEIPARSRILFVYEIPDGTDSVLCRTGADEGDMDMFVSIGEVPSRIDADCLSDGGGSSEVCDLIDLDGDEDGGEVFVLLYGFTEVENGRLICEAFDFDDFLIQLSRKGGPNGNPDLP